MEVKPKTTKLHVLTRAVLENLNEGVENKVKAERVEKKVKVERDEKNVKVELKENKVGATTLQSTAPSMIGLILCKVEVKKFPQNPLTLI